MHYLRNLKITHRLYGGFAILVLLLAGAVGAALWQVSGIEQFPDSVIAGMFNFKPAQLLEFQAEEKADVDVKKLFGS